MDLPLPKVIVVDDDQIVREAVHDILSRRGFTVRTLSSPFALGAAMESEHPNVVLIDVQMPALSGGDLVKFVLKHELHECALVFYSSRPAEELQELVRTSGAAGFIQKTADMRSLPNAVRGFLPKP